MEPNLRELRNLVVQKRESDQKVVQSRHFVITAMKLRIPHYGITHLNSASYYAVPSEIVRTYSTLAVRKLNVKKHTALFYADN